VATRVVVCAASLLLLAGAIVFLMQTFQSGKVDDHRRAETLADHGLTQAYMELGVSSDWSDGFADGPMDDLGGSFAVAIARDNRGDTIDIKIVSTGTSGSIQKTKEEVVRMTLTVSGDGDSTWNKEVIR